MLRTLARAAVAVALAFGTLTAPSPATAAPAPQCTHPVAYFDLGNVLVDSSDPSHMHYLPGAVSYLNTLRARGVNAGLIVNIPETFGTTYDQKLASLKSYLASRWTDATPFDWSYFTGRIVLPLNDADRKPAPGMFRRALTAAGTCPAYYQGENATEISVAASVGLRVYQVNQPGKPFYLPADQVR